VLGDFIRKLNTGLLEDDAITKSSSDSENSPQQQNCLPSANEECHNKDNSMFCIFLQLNIDNKMNLVYLLTLYVDGRQFCCWGEFSESEEDFVIASSSLL
jgi:hypothetical protein